MPGVIVSADSALYSTWQNNTHKSWYRDPGLRKSMISVFVLYLVVFTYGYDSSLLNGLQTLEQWQSYFGNPTGSDLGLISAVLYFPQLALPAVSAYVCEKYGRRPSLLIGCFLCTAGAFIAGFAQSKAMFMGGRAFLGAGLSFQSIAAPALIMELCHPRLRAVSGASYLTVYYVGSTTSAWICFGTQSLNSNWAWRIPALIMCSGVVLIAIYMCLGLLPESPRWLIKNGKKEQAYQLLADLHANGSISDELVINEIAEINNALAQDEMASHTGYTAFLKTPGNRKRLWVILALGTGTELNGVGLVSYYLAPILELIGITSRGQQAGLNGGLAVFNLICAIAAAQVVERWGRRPLWLLGNSGQLVCFTIVTALSGIFAKGGASNVGIAVIPFLYLYYGFYDICWTVLPNLYIPEITPYHLRAKALSVYLIVKAISITFGQYVNPIALERIGWKYYLVYVIIILGYLIFAYFFFVETKGYTIEEVSRLFDGPESVEDIEHGHGDAPLEVKSKDDVKVDVEHVY
ncbi:hypothetical protein C345_06405 [Cryptococcus neoformans A2-102-5]|nr:hypothetical protein C346_06202 [Cryptococcus neoformans var. grubii D17-1]OXG91781.1 hypothetical protein C345_06405 [Cryptococcus neoformans var. grubii A2-102-5]